MHFKFIETKPFARLRDKPKAVSPARRIGATPALTGSIKSTQSTP
jgi:hypothetical protein